MSKENVIKLLQKRGLIDAVSSDELLSKIPEQTVVYAGFDPTASSLHIGNLVAIMGLSWFQKMGYKVVALVGGATGRIGDPSGKSKERQLLTKEQIEKNLEGIAISLKKVLGDQVTIVNNYDWFKDVNWIDFLRDVGRFFRMSTMLAKESVKARLNSEVGLSYTEFSYQIMQAYDFLYLSQSHGVNLQIGGADQWGNITAGIELVRKVQQKAVYGVTFPLLTRSDGKKFGKTEEGTIWLNEDHLSSYDFYQYFIRMPDADVISLLKKLTYLDLATLDALEQEMQQEGYEPNKAQKLLASTMTEMIHGQEGLAKALEITEAAKPGSHTDLTLHTLGLLADEVPTKILTKEALVGKQLIDVLVEAQLQPSKGAARRMIDGGGIYVNNQKVTESSRVVGSDDLIENQVILIGIGKKKKCILKVK